MTVSMSPELLEVLEKYDRPGPRYTSYPTAPCWSEEFGPQDWARRLRCAGADPRPMSLYVHVPFCRSLCWYCGCNVVVCKDPEKKRRYVDDLLREARMARDLMGARRPVAQHHWGGGTPTSLPPEELERLFTGLCDCFPLAEGGEVSIEVDPRVTTREQIEVLASLGFRRMSMGVQDFDPHVQEAIHREQSLERTRALVESARELGFTSVGLDLVYGLPKQNLESFAGTLRRVLELKPDRVACYAFAYVPWLKKHQRLLPAEDLPRGADKLRLYLAALEAFQAAGYRAIGMDHFARPEDELARAAESGRLHRNFMGYTTQASDDLVAFGVTAIGEVDGAFGQNLKSIAAWRAALDAHRPPIERGLRRVPEDERRRRIVLDLMCRFRLRFEDHGGAEAFRRHYAEELERLRPLEVDGLVQVDRDEIRVTPLGRLLVRNVAMAFDEYLHRQEALQASRPVFSRTV